MTLPRVEALLSLRAHTDVAPMRDHLDPLCGSHVDTVNTPPQVNVMSDVYHPMRNLRTPMNFDVTSGFVSMSEVFNDVCIYVIFMLPFWISS
jgi:hypothetical protein